MVLACLTRTDAWEEHLALVGEDYSLRSWSKLCNRSSSLANLVNADSHSVVTMMCLKKLWRFIPSHFQYELGNQHRAVRCVFPHFLLIVGGRFYREGSILLYHAFLSGWKGLALQEIPFCYQSSAVEKSLLTPLKSTVSQGNERWKSWINGGGTKDMVQVRSHWAVQMTHGATWSLPLVHQQFKGSFALVPCFFFPHLARDWGLFAISGLPFHPNQQPRRCKMSPNLSFNSGSIPGLKWRVGCPLLAIFGLIDDLHSLETT